MGVLASVILLFSVAPDFSLSTPGPWQVANLLCTSLLSHLSLSMTTDIATSPSEITSAAYMTISLIWPPLGSVKIASAANPPNSTLEERKKNKLHNSHNLHNVPSRTERWHRLSSKANLMAATDTWKTTITTRRNPIEILSAATPQVNHYNCFHLRTWSIVFYHLGRREGDVKWTYFSEGETQTRLNYEEDTWQNMRMTILF